MCASEFLPLGEFGLKVAEPLTDPVDGVSAEDKAKRRTSGRHGGEDRPGRLVRVSRLGTSSRLDVDAGRSHRSGVLRQGRGEVSSVLAEQSRPEGPRLNDQEADARNLLAEGLSEAFEGEFSGAVSTEPGCGDLAADA